MVVRCLDWAPTIVLMRLWHAREHKRRSRWVQIKKWEQKRNSNKKKNRRQTAATTTTKSIHKNSYAVIADFFRGIDDYYKILSLPKRQQRRRRQQQRLRHRTLHTHLHTSNESQKRIHLIFSSCEMKRKRCNNTFACLSSQNKSIPTYATFGNAADIHTMTHNNECFILLLTKSSTQGLSCNCVHAYICEMKLKTQTTTYSQMILNKSHDQHPTYVVTENNI